MSVADARKRAERLHELAAEAEVRARELDEKRVFIETMLRDRFAGIELLSAAWEQYELARAQIEAGDLIKKSHPAYSSADVVKAKGRELAAARKRVKYLEQLLRLYEFHVPWLTELRDLEAEEGYTVATGAAQNEDPATEWLTREEYAALPPAERDQRALDRYWTSSRSAWKVGRDYERYVGYLYERDGYAVEYHGIACGLEDLGRDVIARHEGVVYVVQCKWWAAHKTIHEKHVFQLFGTVFAHQVENPDLDVRGRFVTTTTLSDTARDYASRLNVEVSEQFAFDRTYPCIKCNVAPKSGERIYHLPFDQMYDQTVVHSSRGEFYTATVAEAEAAGFRRAFRWSGNDGR